MSDELTPTIAAGCRVRDKDGDEGVVVLDVPDSVGEIVWRCDRKGSKTATIGAYYQSDPTDLTLIPSTTTVTVELPDEELAAVVGAADRDPFWADPDQCATPIGTAHARFRAACAAVAQPGEEFCPCPEGGPVGECHHAR